MVSKKKMGIILVLVILALIMVVVLFTPLGRKPFKDLKIASATVRLMPPDETIRIVNPEKLEGMLEEVVIYDRDD